MSPRRPRGTVRKLLVLDDAAPVSKQVQMTPFLPSSFVGVPTAYPRPIGWSRLLKGLPDLVTWIATSVVLQSGTEGYVVHHTFIKYCTVQ